MGLRRMGSKQRTRQRAKTRHNNGIRKTKERARRDARMVEAVKGGALPFTPWVMSWLSVQLDKPSRYITQADVEKVVAQTPAPAGA